MDDPADDDGVLVECGHCGHKRHVKPSALNDPWYSVCLVCGHAPARGPDAPTDADDEHRRD